MGRNKRAPTLTHGGRCRVLRRAVSFWAGAGWSPADVLTTTGPKVVFAEGGGGVVGTHRSQSRAGPYFFFY
jgi:hypothetical protein